MTGFVYFISYGTTNWVKIGYATCLTKRLYQLRVSSPEELTVEATASGTQKDEKALHRALREHRGKGEWFKPAPLVRIALERARRGDSAASVIEAVKAASALTREQASDEAKILEFTRWAVDESLPMHWREEYREILRNQYGVSLCKEMEMVI